MVIQYSNRKTLSSKWREIVYIIILNAQWTQSRRSWCMDKNDIFQAKEFYSDWRQLLSVPLRWSQIHVKTLSRWHHLRVIQQPRLWSTFNFNLLINECFTKLLATVARIVKKSLKWQINYIMLFLDTESLFNVDGFSKK